MAQQRNGKGGMKRLAIFVLAGPGIGMLTVLVPAFATGARVSGLGELVMWTYIGGAGPAFVTGLADWFFSVWLAPLYRAIATGAAGFVVSAIVLAVVFGRDTVLFGAVGVLPGMACSWLSNGKPNVE